MNRRMRSPRRSQSWRRQRKRNQSKRTNFKRTKITTSIRINLHSILMIKIRKSIKEGSISLSSVVTKVTLMTKEDSREKNKDLTTTKEDSTIIRISTRGDSITKAASTTKAERVSTTIKSSKNKINKILLFIFLFFIFYLFLWKGPRLCP